MKFMKPEELAKIHEREVIQTKNMYLNFPGAHGDAGPGTVIIPPSPHEAAKKPGAMTVLVTAESFPTAEN